METREEILELLADRLTVIMGAGEYTEEVAFESLGLKSVNYSQLTTSLEDELDVEITNEIESARVKAEKIHSIFAHDNIMPEDVKKDLNEVDEAIGDVATLEAFVLAAGQLLGARYESVEGGFIFKKLNMQTWMLNYTDYAIKKAV